MDKETMLRYWELMGPGRADEDRRGLHEMPPTPDVLTLEAWAEEALARHHAWRKTHRPDLDVEAREI